MERGADKAHDKARDKVGESHLSTKSLRRRVWKAIRSNKLPPPSYPVPVSTCLSNFPAPHPAPQEILLNRSVLPLDCSSPALKSKSMTDQEIQDSYEQDGFVVVRDIIDDRDLEPLRSFIKAKVDEYAREQYAGANSRRFTRTSPSNAAMPPSAKSRRFHLADGPLALPAANSTISTISLESLTFSASSWALKSRISAVQP